MEQTVVVPGSYKELPRHFSLKGLILGEKVEGMASPTSILGLFTSIPKGLCERPGNHDHSHQRGIVAFAILGLAVVVNY